MSAHSRVLFLIAPTGPYCREDRCQSYFRFDLVPGMRPPLEECEAAGAVGAAGARAFVLDAPAHRYGPAAVLARIAEIGPDLVVIVTTFGTLDDDLAWAERLRGALPAVTLGLRGAPCYTGAEDILRRASALAFCVRGDYELVFDAIVRRGHAGAPGVVWRDGDVIRSTDPPVAGDLDALPWPDRDAIDETRYRVRFTRHPQATVRVQRGCPYPCTYCLVHTVSGAKARHRSPESVAAEMAAVMARGVRHFYLRADTFSLDARWVLATCEAIARRCPGARWVTTTRVDRVDDDVLGAMRRAGCYGVSFGIDTGSPLIGAKIRKPPDLARAHAAMRACDRRGIVSLAYFMIGFVWETRETLAQTASFARAARPDLLTLYYAHPYPGTPYYDAAMAHRATPVSPRAQAEPALVPEGAGLATLRRHALMMTVRHYADPRVMASLARKAPWLARHAAQTPRSAHDPSAQRTRQKGDSAYHSGPGGSPP
jgi:radical SAM superfamily enzyme YgiQ (UPF0313 family)